ncbi:4-(cytidine 5'-diphospho)-2-C-methyl-D-erythritol kinase [Candidatus Mesenet endosymbiont of Phosphuga atrata]|uniref:4-(cytidine 5'-diphospho)-2-C-methyl-D-erythritol kinase n=1 Tax=Candidatus Mesenet endosymbiont of Phosphuga atrata TaxID=3066221 RepID=UPI0030CBDA20
MAAFQAIAPAKINLFLHIVGKKQDNYHLLETFFIFAKLYDILEIRTDYKKSMVTFVNDDCEINSRYNTITKAINLLLKHTARHVEISVRVIKNIPVAAGLGGGSSDAGAVIRILGKYWNIENQVLNEVAANVGADVPVSVNCATAFAKGTGDDLHYYKNFTIPKSIVLVNPGKPLSTTRVFQEYNGNFSAPLDFPKADTVDLIELMHSTKNDLQEVAITIIPEIEDILSFLQKQAGCIIMRMSGSGATCFGIFDSEKKAKSAANNVHHHHPNWWVHTTSLIV